MKAQYVMALDAGSGAGRCVLVNLHTREMHSAYQEWGYTIPPGLGMMAVDFDPAEFWRILGEVSRQAMSKAGIQPEQVVAVSSTSQREGIVLLDDNGNELYAGPNRDYRAVIEGMQLINTYGDELYHRSGHFPASMTGAARLLWCRNHSPQTYEQVRHLQSINDWILFRLSHEYACEPTNAAETSLYDLSSQDWAYDIIEKLELPKEVFPPVFPTGTKIGVVTPQASIETGLRPGTPVVIGGADTQCGLLGCGTIKPNQVAAISGTTTPVQLVTDSPTHDPSGRLWGGAHVVPGLCVVESNAGGSGSVYQWYRDSFFEDAIERCRTSGGSPYEVMNAEAALSQPGCLGVQSYVGTMIFNAKTLSMPPNVIILGMSPLSSSGVSSRPLVTRAVLESLAFAVKANLLQVLDLVGSQPAAIEVCGGLANSRLYLEILANTLQLPVRVPQIKEGTAMGAAISAAIGGGIFHTFDEGVEALVHIEAEIGPDERLCRQYQSFYRKWIKNLEHLMALSTRI
ncbi:MAG: FGGY-family carbohydrate kinase [Acidobacteriaceae bacterium]